MQIEVVEVIYGAGFTTVSIKMIRHYSSSEVRRITKFQKKKEDRESEVLAYIQNNMSGFRLVNTIVTGNMIRYVFAKD
ncbi:MAG: hypothetical protein ACFFDI_32500 [Promethearchaeota archaeon]